MKRVSLVIFIFLLVNTACQMEQGQQQQIGTQKSAMPIEMPKDFNFLVSFGLGEVNKNEINTYDGTVTKDLITQGTKTANITLSMDEKRSIYEQMKAIDIMGTKDLMPNNTNCSKIPYNEDSWKITINGQTKIITWSDKDCGMTDDAKQLLEMRNFIFDIVKEKDVYQSLPEAEGGYD